MHFLCYETNQLDPWVPEFWAMESIAILEENMVIAGLIHRDFQPIIANEGDVINTRKPGEYKARRKGDNDDVTVQDSTATNIQVPLDQHFHTSFIIRDGQESRSRHALVDEYLRPGMLSIARAIDQVCLAQVPRFLTNVSGRLNLMTKTNAQDYILETRERMNVNKAWVDGRNVILTPFSETAVLGQDLFLSAERVGDGGTALAEAFIGRKLGFDFWMSQNASGPNPESDLLVATGTVTNAVAKGATLSGAVSVTGHEATVGEYAVIITDDTPNVITAATVGAGNTTAIDLENPNRFATLAAAVLKVYKKVLVNGAQAAGYSKYVSVDGLSAATNLKVGQIIAFGAPGATRHVYTIIDIENATASSADILLDRPLEKAIADDDPAFPGPNGNYNFAFHRNALALVVRPLAAPRPGTGAASAVINHNNVSMRVTMQYQGLKQGTLVTLDLLCGVAVLDTDLGCVMLG